MPCKEENWRKIGGKVNKLRMGTGVKKIEPKKTHKCEEQEGPCAWTEEPVVEPQAKANDDPSPAFMMLGPARMMKFAEIFFEKGVDSHGNQQKQDQPTQKVGPKMGKSPYRPSPEISSPKRCHGGWEE